MTDPMISPTLALLVLLAPQAAQEAFDFQAPWTFRETTAETSEREYWPALEVLDPADGGVLARSTERAWLKSPLVGPGLDGDGRRELFVVVGSPVYCSADIRQSSLRAISNDEPRELGRLSAWVHFRPEYDVATGWLLRGESVYRHASLELRPGLRGEAAWRLEQGASPVGNVHVARFVGDLDGDGRREVAVGNAWAELPGEGDGRPWVGALALLDARDGHTLWRAFGRRAGEGFARDVAPAGDVDGDGTDDVAVLSSTIDGTVKPARVVVLSGRDGVELVSTPIERVTGAPRVSVYSRAGLRDVPEVPTAGLPWKGARVVVARLSPERAWDLLSIRRGGSRASSDELVVTPGPPAR